MARIALGSAVGMALAVLVTVPNSASAQRALPPGPTRSAPEMATPGADRPMAAARRHMVSAANPLASSAGREILRAGGSAVDAAIAVQLVLNLVEPQSSGLGGGAFLLHWEAKARRMRSYDGRETAPAAARPDRFVRDGGRPVPFPVAVRSGAAVGVPGTLAMLALAHKHHGRLPWAVLFEPALRIAREGFPVSPRLSFLLGWMGSEAFSPAARRTFFDGQGRPWPAGHRLVSADMAATLSILQRDGAKALHEGPIAAAIVAAVAGGPEPRGDMTLADLAGYEALERAPLCIDYRRHRICGMGPPSSGGIAVAQTLMLLEPFDLGSGRRAALNPRAMHLIAEAQKLAYADRNRYIADPDRVAIPAALTAWRYVEIRRRLIDTFRAGPRPEPGTPLELGAGPSGEDATVEATGTSHVSIIDGEGNAVALTTTIEAAFGSRLMAAGFLLNNELTDFSFRPADAKGRPIANRIEGGKRPRSSMAPTIVLGPDGTVRAVLGSPGGSRIPLYVVKTLVALIDWELDPQQAAALVNFGSRGEGIEIEAVTADAYSAMFRPWAWSTTIGAALRLKPYGHRITFDLMTSGTHVVGRRTDGTLEGGADPRREGVALGD